jgi:hypothetical protein
MPQDCRSWTSCTSRDCAPQAQVLGGADRTGIGWLYGIYLILPAFH